ncbi:WD40-repeat-containing domain protein [Suillus clintonianus]|uniref:WD40-repeat-containing domain protein n=1 Tax=Suillus clintonianus TaxID=1904413 RepID=UPI001B87E31A|nr:WD40-repeat-containing domain protein [Suillus clintonianus]KAG2123814.1 WD40-repeat-containing domain protein [Suillus clintonianus]
MAARFPARQTHTHEEAPVLVQSLIPIRWHGFGGHKLAIEDFVFLHDNIHIVSASDDGTMRKWNRNTGGQVGEPWIWKGGSIHALALSLDGKTIACGRNDGNVQRWNSDGKIISVWMGHTEQVRSLSWSPSGSHIASGSYDGTILIRRAESGKVEVGPIKTKQIAVEYLAYSPSEKKIASGGYNNTICIWDSKTGKLVLGPIEDVGNSTVTSLVWSPDSRKLYCASDKFARVFDSTSGTLLHCYETDNVLYSVALSPTHNVLACVGDEGIVQLWDTESHQPLGPRFCQDRETLFSVSFSRDGRYLACGGNSRRLILYMVSGLALHLRAPISQQGHGQLTQQEPRLNPQQETLPSPRQETRSNSQQGTRPESPLSSYLSADATGNDGIIEEGSDDPYHNFFQSSQPSLTSTASGSPQPLNLSSAQRFWNTISRRRPPTSKAVPQERPKRHFFTRRAHSNSPLEPTTINPKQPTPNGKVRAGEDNKEGDKDNDPCSANDPLEARKDKCKERDEPPSDSQNPPLDDSPKLNNTNKRKLWKRLTRARGMDPTDTKIAPAAKRPEVVEVYAVRGFQGYVAMKRVRKTELPTVTCSAPLPATHPSASSQPGLSLQVVSVQAGPSSQAMVGNSAQTLRAVGGSSSHASPSHFVTNYHTNHDSDSRSSIEGSCNRFLDRICFPRGHYYKDS